MKAVFSLLFIYSHLAVGAPCQLDPGRPVVSLSGVISHTLHQLQLLPQLKAMASFHQLPFAGKTLAGGVFTSPQLLREHVEDVIFLDESAGLQKTLQELKAQRAVVVRTRGLDPFEAIERSVEVLKPYLKGCAERLQGLAEMLARRRQGLLNLRCKRRLFLFLGPLYRDYPQTLMNRDGLGKFLFETLKVPGYPSELSYISWSDKILKDHPQAIKIGLVTQAKGPAWEEVRPGHYHLYGKSLLIPGFPQLRALEHLQRAIQEEPWSQ